MSLAAGSMQRELGSSGSATAAHSARANSTKIQYALVHAVSAAAQEGEPGPGTCNMDLPRCPGAEAPGGLVRRGPCCPQLLRLQRFLGCSPACSARILLGSQGPDLPRLDQTTSSCLTALSSLRHLLMPLYGHPRLIACLSSRQTGNPSRVRSVCLSCFSPQDLEATGAQQIYAERVNFLSNPKTRKENKAERKELTFSRSL